MADAAIDFPALLARTLGRQDVADEMLGLFRADAPRLLAAVRMPADADAVRRGLHRLKGSARTIGANALADAIVLAESEQPTDAATQLDAVAGEVARCVNAIDEHLRATTR